MPKFFGLRNSPSIIDYDGTQQPQSISLRKGVSWKQCFWDTDSPGFFAIIYNAPLVKAKFGYG